MRIVALILALLLSAAVHAGVFRAGYADRDITPTEPMPMWGYGARHALLTTEALDPLFAQAVVLEAGTERLALVALDLGRSPTARNQDRIREAVAASAGITQILLCGTHTHHGPVLELLDRPGLGQGRFDAAVRYAGWLNTQIADAINEAASRLEPVRWGWESVDSDLNRNRHTMVGPRPRDPELAVVRLDHLDGTPLAVLVNFAAHPTIHKVMDRRWSADWPGAMKRHVREALGAPCIFLQGAAGDMGPNRDRPGRETAEGFGQAAAETVLPVARRIQTTVPEHPSLRGSTRDFAFPSRVDFSDPFTLALFKQAFFPEMLAMLDDVRNNTLTPRITTVLLNGELALAGGSGEFFCEHGLRLKAHSPAKKTLFLGYCNGHHMYIPTRQAIALGGYGAAPAFAWLAEGAGETMIDGALEMLRELTAATAEQPPAR
ncbi:MAG: hypothetical protein HYV27_01980 [Candidatus Hydrogenedentes bacterium]|nr:hypothetical protein [Candidatus Hydrogenedentota bacterium]